MNTTHNGRNSLLNITRAMSLGAGMMALSAYGQGVIEVGGNGTIADTVLDPGSALSIDTGSNWTVEGNAAGATFFIESHLVSPPAVVTTAGNVTLIFNHRYFYESGWDGGGVYVSKNGLAATYVPIGDLTGQVYDGTATLGTAWAGGEEVFTGKSPDYDTSVFVQTVADLGAFAVNDTVSVEFRGGWDEGYSEPGVDWEINTVKITDAGAADIVDLEFPVDGPSGMTLASAGGGTLTDPWVYKQPTHRFEIDADLLTADTYSPNGAETVIDLNGATIEVVLLTGVLNIGDTFTLFDLSAPATLAGSPGSVSLPGGSWDTSNLAVDGTITCLVPPPLLEDSFDYAVGNLNGKDGGTGFSGPWSATRNNPSTALPDKLWGELGTAGGYALGNAWSGLQRPIGTTLSDKGLMDDGATLWFSIIFDLQGQNFANADLNFALCTEKFESGTFGDRENLVGGEGIGIGHSGGNINGVYWQNDDADAISERHEQASSFSLTGGSPRGLIVGKIEWGATGVDPEVLTLYAPDLNLNLGTPIAGPYNTVALDQSLFDQISLQFKDSSQMDEIRFGATSDDVLPPDVFGPEIVTTTPVNAEPDASAVYYSADFNEPVFIGTGDIRVINVVGDVVLTTIDVTDGSQVAISSDGFGVEINPTVVGVPDETYYIEMDSGTIVDFSANPFAGISGSATWSFTASSAAPTITSIDSTPAGDPIFGTPTINYTVNFDKFYVDDATVTEADFVNAGTADLTVGAVTRVSGPLEPASYSFTVTTNSFGTVQMQAAGAISDEIGNVLVVPVNDDTTINLDAGPEPVRKTISLLNYAQGQDIGGGGDKTLAVGFGATGADKLVVVLGGEGGNPKSTNAKFNSVTFGGVAMTEAVQQKGGIPAAAIFYLDAPAQTTGDVVVNQDNHNGTIFAIYALSGTAPGIGGANKSTTNPSSVDLITATSGSLVIAGVLNSGPDGANGGTNMSPVLPLVEDPPSDLESGSRWVSMCHARGTIPTPGYGIYSFSGANPTDLLATVAVDIQAAIDTSDYTMWAAIYAPADLSDPDADNDGDGWTNDEERLFGLDPTSGASVNPISVPLDSAAGTFSFTRRDPSLTGKFTDIETSTDLAMWTKDPGAMLTPGTPDGNGVQTVGVELSPGLLTAPKLFVRVNQNDGTVFSANFEDDNGGFTLTGSPNDWEYGTPNANNGASLILTGGNGGSMKCWATVLGTGGNPSGGITPGSDSILRSPAINLVGASGAQLQFAAAIDALDGVDNALEVLVREVGTDALLETVNPVTLPYSDTNWNNYGPFAIPGAAGKDVYLEFRFMGSNALYIGFYLDDVTVQQTP